MPDEYGINVTTRAKEDLNYYKAGVKKTVTSAIRSQLTHEPTKETRNRKPLLDHPIASWELRCEKYRVFYDVDEDAGVVKIVSVGHKEREKLFIRGEEVKT